MTSTKKISLLVVLSVLLQFIPNKTGWAEDNNSTNSFPSFKLEEVASGLNYPWGMVFLNENTMLVTQRDGQAKIISTDGKSTLIDNVPQSYVRSQGGLLDVILHPNYATNGWIYFSQAVGESSANATSIFRAKLKNNALVNVETIFTATPTKDTAAHYGGRMAFLPDNSLVLTIGDGFNYREDAQKLSSLLGKIVRMNDDGTVPSNNPFVQNAQANDYIWSYGHRNPQGIVYDHKNQILFEHEHGPKGGDEVNIITAGKNYGWPVITYGVDYSGAQITPFKQYKGMEQPFVDWTPSIAPSSMAIYYGDMFPQLSGDLLVTALKYKELRWLKMTDGKVVAQTSLLNDRNERLRHVVVGPDGAIYLLTDASNGKILRLSKK